MQKNSVGAELGTANVAGTARSVFIQLPDHPITKIVILMLSYPPPSKVIIRYSLLFSK